MNATEGLLAEASVESDDNQQEQEVSISHLEGVSPSEAKSVDEVTVASEDEETEFVKPDWYPAKFWNDDEGPDLENLVKSYNELQKKFSQGKHKAPEAYDDSVFTSANIPQDDELFVTYKEWAKENGISQSAFDELAQKFLDMSGSEAQQAQLSYQEEYKKLGPNADATIKSMTDWAQSLVRKGVWGENDFEEFKIMGGTADGIRALQKIRAYYGDQTVPVDVSTIEDGPSREELTAMVGRPEYNTDPAYRAKVERMFEKMYGGEPYQPI
jgi:hypothetical protein